MASFEEDKALYALAMDKASESLGALQQAHSALEQAQGVLLQVSTGSSRSEVPEANALFARAISGVQEVQQVVHAAIQAAEGVAART